MDGRIREMGGGRQRRREKREVEAGWAGARESPLPVKKQGREWPGQAAVSLRTLAC